MQTTPALEGGRRCPAPERSASVSPPTRSPCAGTTSPLVMAHLPPHGARSRAPVAAETGLNKATVSSLVAELVERGLVTEGETERGASAGPRGRSTWTATTYFTVGAEINLDYLAVVALNVRGEFVAERWIAARRRQHGARRGAPAHGDRGPRRDRPADRGRLTAGRGDPRRPRARGDRDRDRPRGPQPGLVARPRSSRPCGPARRPRLPAPARQRGQPGRPRRGRGAPAPTSTRPGAAHRRGRRRCRRRHRRPAAARRSRASPARSATCRSTAGAGSAAADGAAAGRPSIGLNALLGLAADPDDPVRDPSMDVVRRLDVLPVARRGRRRPHAGRAARGRRVAGVGARHPGQPLQPRGDRARRLLRPCSARGSRPAG